MSYIIGIDRKYERLELPTDDFLLCDLDQDSVMFSTAPPLLPPTVRQKLAHLLSLSVRSHLSRGVPVGPPAYIRECYPENCFTATDRTLLSPKKQPPGYGKFVGLRSISFADATFDPASEPPVFNAFQYSLHLDDKEFDSFLWGGGGTVKSVTSVSSGRGGRHASQPSFSSGSTLRDIAANLRHPTQRGSGLWAGSFGRNSDKNVPNSSPTIEWVIDGIDVYVRYSCVEFWIFPAEGGVFGYVVCEWVCSFDFTVFDGTFEYYEFRCVADAGAES